MSFCIGNHVRKKNQIGIEKIFDIFLTKDFGLL